MRQTNKFIVAGDWHGNWPQAERVIRHAKETNVDTIVHVGDFGIWSNDKPYLNRIQALLKQWDIQMYFIDGNHEDFPRLYAKPLNEDGTRKVRDNISHLPRGFRWEWDGISFLALGGAASIDKKFRREGISWWPEELITDEDVAKSIEGGKVDVMFTHDSPESAPNFIVDDAEGQANAMAHFGYPALANCVLNRMQLQRVTDIVSPRLLFHGHYHAYMSSIYRHADGTPAQAVGLDQGIAKLEKNAITVSTDTIYKHILSLDEWL